MLNNQWWQDAYKKLAMGISYFYDSDINLVQANVNDIQELTKIFMEETLSELENLIPVLYVCHADQGATHIHRLYMLRNE